MGCGVQGEERGEAVTNEQRVKKVYPEACCRSHLQSDGGTRYVIWSKPPQYLGAMELGEAAHRVSWAWGDAARNLKAKRKGAK